MNRTCEQFLARPAFTFDQDRTLSLGNIRQDVEEALHRRTATDDIRKGVFALQALSQFFDQTQVAETLDPSDHVSIRVSEDCGRQADGNAAAAGVQDEDVFGDDRTTCLDGIPQGALIFANTGPKDLAARVADSFLSRNSGDLGRRSVEGDDPPTSVDGKHPVRHRVEHDGAKMYV